MYTSFSRILEKIGKRLIGLKWSAELELHLLGIGIIFAIFSGVGNVPVENDWLNIWLNANSMLLGDDLITKDGMPSQPELNFEVRFFNIFLDFPGTSWGQVQRRCRLIC